MKIEGKEKLKLWEHAEKALTQGIFPEQMRTSGLLTIHSRGWSSALLRLEEAVNYGIHDLETLDALGEAAYRAKMPEALLPHRELYKNPTVAIHMARALLILREPEAALQFLSLADLTILKLAIGAMLAAKGNIETAINSMLEPFSHPTLGSLMPNLSFIEYWEMLPRIADAAGRNDLVDLAERKLKAWAYENPVGHFNQSIRFMNEGQEEAAWRLFDWHLVPGAPYRTASSFGDLSLWEGEYLAGKKLLVVMEFGFGDQIFSLRFLDFVKHEATAIEIAAPQEMIALIQDSFPDIKVHDLKKARQPGYWPNLKDKSRPDFWCYSNSIPARAIKFDMRTTKGFLTPNRKLTTQYKTEIQKLNPNQLPVYGIVWHGDARTAAMRSRNYSIQEFLQESKILKKPAVVICLQKTATAEDSDFLKTEVERSGGVFVNAAPTLHDFSHTAAWINNLTHFYSSDTASAHLAGALGLPATVLARNKAIWAWRCDENLNSLWYDSVKVQYALTPEISYMFELNPYLENQ